MYRFKRIEIAAAMALLLTLIVSALYTRSSVEMQDRIADKMVRLHVLANSDSEEDQRRKLLVKDAVFARTEELLRQAANREEAERMLERALPELQALAEDTLRADGRAEPVEVLLTDSSFSTRYYERFTLPAGEYRALRVHIGAGEGRNWWCVVFPPLCSGGTESLESAAQRAGLTEEELALIQSGEQQYVLRFRTLELFHQLRTLLAGGAA